MAQQSTLSLPGATPQQDHDDTGAFTALKPYWRVTIAAFLGWFMDAFDQVALLLCLPDIGHSLGAGLTAMGFVITAQSIGRVIGNTSWGWLSDKHGRKITFMLGVMWFAAFSGLTAVTWTYAGMVAVQFLFGIGFGGEWTASAALLMESVPARSRSLASAIMMAGYECGFLAAAAIQPFVLPHWGWRGLFVIGVLPAVLAVFIRRGVPESPVWLKTQETARQNTRPVSPPKLKLTGAAIQAFIFMAVLQFQNAAIYSFYPTVLREVQKLSPGAIFPLIAAYCVGSLAGKPVCGLLAARIGERPVFVGYFLITLLDIWPFVSGQSDAILLPAALVMGLFGNAVFALVPHYLSQRFPSSSRSFGMGCSYALAALGQGIAGFFVPWLGSRYGLPVAISTSVIIGTLAVTAAVFYRPPTLPGAHMEGEEA
ncbi:MFS transporter [Acetobacter oeni]|uniref:MFS transporter n=1 Tax=Acetobacter oeni TaxID=304077 RepID=A0A511XHL6_9PROT|nr:MFS transporter [Acetobacter oeni]MBB3881285.1 SHS family lactate transporter-like MFS transporter [Acetobacter oeni]GEN62440.1 MFS transporter [Acetobacter oeni]